MITKTSYFASALVFVTVMSVNTNAISLNSQGNWLTNIIGWDAATETNALNMNQELKDLSLIEKENSLVVTQDLRGATSKIMPEHKVEEEKIEKPKQEVKPAEKPKEEVKPGQVKNGFKLPVVIEKGPEIKITGGAAPPKKLGKLL